MLLLADNLTNICSVIGKIRINLWMVYTDTCNVKELEEVEKTSWKNKKHVLCIVDQDHQRCAILVVDQLVERH